MEWRTWKITKIVFIGILILLLEGTMSYVEGLKNLLGLTEDEEISLPEKVQKAREKTANYSLMKKKSNLPEAQEVLNQPSPVYDYFNMFLQNNKEFIKSRGEEMSTDMPSPEVNYTATGYKEGLTTKTIERIIREESRSRNIDPNVAVRVYRKEGLNSYQSNEKYKGKRERSYGPFQLFIDGGLGEEYQNDTGGNLIKENNKEGILRQIRWSLDHVAKTGDWSPWKGTQKENHGGVIESFEGLNGAKAIGNWRE